ncbi:hypothetical protein OC835_006740 [Tilletia horrida]|nr:hypothetical protein OC835_006740 [Tilletia horrida]
MSASHRSGRPQQQQQQRAAPRAQKRTAPATAAAAAAAAAVAPPAATSRPGSRRADGLFNNPSSSSFNSTPGSSLGASTYAQRVIMSGSLPVHDPRSPGQLLGSGAFGKVYLAKLSDGTPCAKKVVDLHMLTPPQTKKVIEEAQLLSSTKHANIIEGFGFAHDLQTATLSIFMTYAEQGDLASDIKTGRRPPAAHVEIALAELSDALEFLHGGAGTGSAIIHRDIKPANILGHRGHYMLADFGLARRLNEGSLMASQCGTANYMAPELLQGHQYTNKVDVFALGVTIFEYMTGQLPFKSTDMASRLTEIKAPHLTFSPGNEEVVPTIRNMLAFSPHARPSTQDIKKHPRLDRALLLRDVNLQQQSNIVLQRKVDALEAREKTSLESQLGQAATISALQQEVRRLKNQLALVAPTSCTTKDDVISACRALLSSEAARVEAGPSSPRVTRSRVTSLTIADAMAAAFAHLRSQHPEQSWFLRGDLIRCAKELGKLEKTTSDDQVQTFLRSTKRWAVNGKAWTMLSDT